MRWRAYRLCLCGARGTSTTQTQDCVFVYDDPEGKEIFAIGMYVDNIQAVHSAELNDDGDPVDDNSFYSYQVYS